MAISDSDSKILWGRAAGICSNPACREDLTKILKNGQGYHIGEMAHIIARSSDGPRGAGSREPDNSYENLILLCPACHTEIDKAPSEFPVDLLHGWKAEHEERVSSLGKELKFSTPHALKAAVAKLLAENHAVWLALGPKSEAASDFGSNLHIVWDLRKLDTIIPNNHRIVNMVEANGELLSGDDWRSFLKFKVHATSFEANQYNRLDSYPEFPREFEELFTA
jgi:hypothetical protein